MQIYVSQFWLSVSCMQRIIHIMHKGYIGHQSLEDRTLLGQNGCLTPSHFVTQPLNLVSFGQVDLCFVFLFIFGQIVIRTKSHVFFLVDCNQDSKPCKIQSIKFVFIFIQSITMKHFDPVELYYLFIFFLYKKKVATPHHLPKKRGALQIT